jgi:hypothetical protein
MRRVFKKILPLLIILFCYSFTSAQRYKITEVKSNTEIKSFKKILLLGEGNISARLFFENLSEKMILKLNKLNIICTYKFVESTKTKVNLEDYIDKDHDAFILFIPQKYALASINVSSNLDINLPSSNSYATINTNSRSVLFEETYLILFFENNFKEGDIWSAELDVNCDFSSNKIYKKISNKLMGIFKKNNLIPNKNE